MSDSWDKKDWELKTIGEIATDIYSGTGVDKKHLNTGNYPAIKCGDINSDFLIWFKECISFVDPELIENKKYFEYGDILVSDLSNKLKTIGKSVAYLNKEKKCILGRNILLFKHNENPRYLAHALSSAFCRKQIEKKAQGGIVFRLYVSKLKQIKVPIPPRHIQDKIADFLDKLLSLKEELKRELTSELKERIKQYQYYLNLLIVGREEEGKFIPYQNNRWDSNWYLFWNRNHKRTIRKWWLSCNQMWRYQQLFV